MIQQIKNAEGLVKEILASYPETRSDDKKLILKVWEAQGLILTPEQKNLFKTCFSTETIRRTRQKIQEEGQFEATDEVKHARKKKEKEMHAFFAKKPIRFEFVGDKAVPVYQ